MARVMLQRRIAVSTTIVPIVVASFLMQEVETARAIVRGRETMHVENVNHIHIGFILVTRIVRRQTKS